MITDINEMLKIGAPWPPEDPDERKRQADLLKGELLYNDEHADPGLFPRVAEWLKDWKENKKKCQIILSLPRESTETHMNLLFGEAPTIAPVTDEATEREGSGSDTIDQLIEDGLLAVAEEVGTDLVRYGTGIFQIGLDEDGKPTVVATNPRKWIPVTQKGVIRKTTQHIIYDIFEEMRKGKDGTERKIRCLHCTIHVPGYVSHRIFDLGDPSVADVSMILKKIGWVDNRCNSNEVIVSEWPKEDVEAFLNTKFDEDMIQAPFGDGGGPLLLVVLSNKMTSERWYGRSDYSEGVLKDVEAFEMAAMENQLANANFCQPTIYGPQGAFGEPDYSAEGRGRYVAKLDHVIELMDKDSPAPGALIWDINHVAQEAQLTRLFHHLLDSLGVSVELMAGREAGGTLSGTALKMRLIPVVAKVGRYQTHLDRALKQVVSICCQLNGEDVAPKDVSITWRDGIPVDQLETSNVIRNLHQANAISTKAKVEMREYPDVEGEVERIDKDIERDNGMGAM